MTPILPQRRSMLPGQAADSVNAFAFDFYRHRQAEKPDNLIFSPFSIWLALMMVYAGARNQTGLQMQLVLHLPLAENDPHTQATALMEEIMSRQDDFMGGETPELNIANRLWGQSGLPFEAAYLETLANSYGSDMAQVDFRGGALDQIAAEINAWVAHQTRDKIPQIVTPRMLSTLTRLILVNAIYFKGRWQWPFSATRTRDAPFHLLEGGTTTVRMMAQKATLPFVIQGDFAAVHLPYKGGALAMLLILPAEGQFLEFERRFDGALFQDLSRRLQGPGEEAEIYLPRFELNTTLALKDALITLGMPDAFDAAAADLSGMAVVPKDDNLYIGAGVHRAYVKVDELGTEAAAVTAIGVLAMGPMVEKRPPVIRFDRPFLYVLYDMPTQAILFMGRVMNPAE